MNEKILLLRYSDFHGIDTIQAHKEVIDKKGSCWWAKIGKQPRAVYLESFLSQENKTVLLYTSCILFKCSLIGITKERPTEAYPNYYNDRIFDKDIEPSLYFKLSAIEQVDVSFLDNYVVCSSGKSVMEDLRKTISSYMFIQDKRYPLLMQKSTDKPKTEKKVTKQVLKPVFDKRTCMYKKDGVCANRSCVNYQYECERPQNCAKQKPIKV